MPIRISDLRTRMLRASPSLHVGSALKDLRDRPQPEEWLLIYQQVGGYAIVSATDLAQRWQADGALLNRTFEVLDLSASPTVDAEIDLAEAQAQLATTGYVMVLRDDAPWGVLVSPTTVAAPAMLSDLLARAADWQPPAARAVLTEEEATPKAPLEATKLEAVPTRTDRYVNTDFATEQDPAHALNKKVPLRPGQWYFLRINVGELETTSIDEKPEQLPDVILKEDVDIRVVVFSERFAVPENTGVLRVPTSGVASVREPASTPAAIGTTPLIKQRLLFRVQAPAAVGLADLRVNLYCKGMLIQSRLITARVGAGRPLNQAGSQRVAVLDFNLSPTLAPSLLSEIAPHKLSMMLNSDSAGNQSFRLLGQQGQELFTNSATFEAGAVNDLINIARGALQRVAWGYDAEWDGKASYRYEPGIAAATLKGYFEQDLFGLAAEGARFYAAIKNNLAAGKNNADKLREMMREPGLVQMASKISAGDVAPIALLYDYKLDSQTANQICPTFEASLASGRSLSGEPCFLGNCPNRDNKAIVCPSGFWGFRHDIGLPCPTPYGPEVALEIKYAGQPLMDVATYTDFPRLPGHLTRLDQLGYQVQRQSQREQVTQMFLNTKPQLVYFYCHGVLQGTKPSLKIGSEAAPGYLTLDNWSNLEIEWPDTRPLIFINGCHTTAISPAQALNLIKVLVEDVEAAGVIGTEITVFEPLAQSFAETFLPLFLSGTPLGRAVRETRLRLLAQRNLLGLVYVPHAYAELKLVGAGS
jgi:hypothetical protein